MRPEMRFTPPLRARRRIAGLVMPWMLSRSTFRWRLAPPLPSPLPPLPRPDMADGLSLVRAASGRRRSRSGGELCCEICRMWGGDFKVDERWEEARCCRSMQMECTVEIA
uniref:Uncharacterized protein n=1 Tax=Triticum urartu TaxID=4572 RepID=A0A8R7RFF8_TRIUA